MVTLAVQASRFSSVRPRIEIVGVFGSGKSTIAASLTEPEDFLAETHDLNPFWGDSDALAVTGYLPYDLAFLIQHCHLVSRTPTKPTVGVCDWSFVGDRLWASMRLGRNLEIYEQVYEAVMERVGPPIGYLYLSQPVDTVVARLRRRGREPERELERYVESATINLERAINEVPSDRVMRIHDNQDPRVIWSQVAKWMQRHG